MKYTIGEVSEIMNLSRDMIRYYEKQGAIRASRNPENNYRYYDEMEIFWLLEAAQHKSWGAPINEIQNIRKNRYTVNTSKFLEKRITELDKETIYLTLLNRRLREIKERMELGTLNIGNFWVTYMPASYRCHLVRARDDNYEKIDIPEEASKIVFSEKMFPFFDSGFTASEDIIDWEMSLNTEYYTQLGENLSEDFTYIPESLALCTHIDIGEIGEFDMQSFNSIRDYAREHHFNTADSTVRGFLIGRGYEDGHFRRIVRVFLPIEVDVNLRTDQRF